MVCTKPERYYMGDGEKGVLVVRGDTDPDAPSALRNVGNL